MKGINEMENSKEKLMDKLNPHCFRKPGSPLVYVATPKCASTFYTTLLLDNGWDRILFSEIDWDTDHVFGFINDPDIRFYKGLAQDVMNVNDFDEEKGKTLENNVVQTLANFKQDVIVFSSHSMPVYIKYGEYCNKIDWIPIVDGVPHHELFLKLLKQYNLSVEFGENLDPNIANDYKKNYYTKFKAPDIQESDLYKIFIAGNRDLFNQVRSKINPSGSNWQEISWLKDKNTL